LLVTTNQYPDVIFPDDVATMFANFILEHNVRLKVFLFIVEQTQKHQATTIPDIIENVVISHRRKKKTKGKNTFFEKVEDNIDRKLAEKIIDQLYCMSLIYYEQLNPYKRIFLTIRGIQVVSKLQEINEKMRK